MPKNIQKQLVIYQGKNGAIEFRSDFDKETIWGTQKQIAELFGVGIPAINKHLQNIFISKELDEKVVVSILAITTEHGAIKGKTQTKAVKFYNFDAIISIGYRVNSKHATQFRIWATKVLKQHLVQGYTINKKRIGQNYEKFMQAVADVKALPPAGNRVTTEDVLELINAFAGTWFSLDAYDTDTFPKTGSTKKKVIFSANELSEALTALTLLIAESNPRDKDRMVGLVLLLLKK